ncbi:MAG: DUF2726 domain-containing protein, partial [Beijerinckiaceae bacterium]
KSKGEKAVFGAARDVCGEAGKPGFYVMAQVSFGEMFDCEDHDAYRQINWMRCDVVIVDLEGLPRMVIEVQGAGHFGYGEEKQRKVRINDTIKRHVCVSAGVELIEITGEVTSSDVGAKITARLMANRAA